MADRLFVIGAQRSGTTLLARLLGAHPDIEFAPLVPEPKFFLRERPADSDVRAYDQTVFGAPPDNVAVRAEKSTTYLERPDAATRLQACFPGAMVVAVLRDPVDRALSNYRFSVAHGWETWPLDRAMSDEGEARHWPRDRLSTSPYHYRRRGHYAQLLAPWTEVFGQQLTLLTHREVIAPGPAMDRLLASLDLSPPNWPRRPAVVNASPNPVEDDTAIRVRLAQYFAPHNEELARRHGVDVSAWTRP